MDRVERIRRLRDKYEAALDEADRLRADYHREILKLHRSGMSLREIAEQLGISHQRVHQIVGVAEPRRRRRAIGGAVAALVLVAGLTVGLVATRAPEDRAEPQPAERRSLADSSRYLLCDVVVFDRPGSAFTPLTMAAEAARCAKAGTVVVLEPRTGQILATIDPRAQGVAEDLLDDERSG